MNLYLTAFAIRRVLAIGLVVGAGFFGQHMIGKAQEASVDSAAKAVEASGAGHVKNTGDGTFEVDGGGTKVTVKGLPGTAE